MGGNTIFNNKILQLKANTLVKIKPVVEGSIEALQVENEHLRMENVYLKKLNV